jgi:septal ring factor EnvC (AmiA/AmiB activator)
MSTELYTNATKARIEAMKELQRKEALVEQRANTKRQLLEDIERLEGQAIATDNQHESDKIELEKAKAALAQINAELNNEQKKLIKVGDEIWQRRVALSKQFNNLIDQAATVYDQLMADFSNDENTALSLAFGRYTMLDKRNTRNFGYPHTFNPPYSQVNADQKIITVSEYVELKK